MTFEEIIYIYLDGGTEGQSTLSKSKPGHLRIEGNKLIHYNTTIVERIGNNYKINKSKYSIQTGKLVKRISSLIKSYRIALGVPIDYSGSLVSFVEREG